MRRPTEKLIAGIDLHSNNLVIAVIDQDGKRISHQKLDCSLESVEQFLKPYKQRLRVWLWSRPTTGIGWWMDCEHAVIRGLGQSGKD